MTRHYGTNLVASRAWAEIDLDALRFNVHTLLARLGLDRALMAVVKADAYGHGLLPIARSAVEAGASWLGVATVSEGVLLREAGISAPIALLCSPTPADAETIVAQRLTPQIGESTLAAALATRTDLSRSMEAHIEIDTGIGRSGVLPKDAVNLWRQVVSYGIDVRGISTHFADADGADEGLSQLQWQRFCEARAALTAAGAHFDWIHADNSAATLRFRSSGCNLVRPGLLLYGLRPTFRGELQNPEGEEERTAFMRHSLLQPPLDLRPVLSLKARIGTVRDLPAGHTISYGATCRLSRPSRLATMLIGYGDGYPRRLSNSGAVLLHGRRAPILGRVCMDQTVVDVTDIPDVTPGDVAVCIGSEGDQVITAEEIAQSIDTTEHEITTCLTGRIPRLYLDTRL